jgi:hypothetical protein
LYPAIVSQPIFLPFSDILIRVNISIGEHFTK